MVKPYSKDRLLAGIAQKDKFSAAEKAMSDGVFDPSLLERSLAEPIAAIAEHLSPVPAPVKEQLATNSGFVRGSRITKKIPKGESVIIRDTFSLPPDESARIDALRVRAAQAGIMLNRSEVIRAGVVALASLHDDVFASIVNNVPKLKMGRPAGSSK